MIENIVMPKFEPKGLIKIELFDELTGKKSDEVNTHNFIAKSVYDVLFKAKMRDVFLEMKPAGGFSLYSRYSDPFAQMSLTSAEHDESPEKEWLREGELIGFAYSDVTYTGPDLLRGGYNVAESSTKAERVRMVFDFPTNAGNGTFKSIYFHPKTSALRATPATVPRLTGLLSLQKYKGKYYLLKTQLEVYGEDWELINTYTVPGGNGVKDFCITNDTIYYVRDNGANTITKAALSDPTAVTNVKDFGTGYTGGICFNEVTQEFIVGDYTSSSAVLIFYDVNFVELKRVLLGNLAQSGGSYGEGKLLIDEENKLFLGRNSVSDFKYVTLMTDHNIRGVADGILFAASYELPKFFIGSRSLLDVPITKTNKQTMKITYDFVLPPM
ncbi:hypothetical protein [Sporosarcina sp. FSL K6-5500]|uniref:hypothetical protein n=1 Tax=Sporosarcina sp. FSL K6-5500 TaxID=2921558 RepID=UPI0030F65A6F